MRIKVATTVNEKHPENVHYEEVEVLRLLQSKGRDFALHSSYNTLIKCYMLSDVATGKVLKAFSVPAEDDAEHIIAFVRGRALDYLEAHTERSLDVALSGLPVVNP